MAFSSSGQPRARAARASPDWNVCRAVVVRFEAAQPKFPKRAPLLHWIIMKALIPLRVLLTIAFAWPLGCSPEVDPGADLAPASADVTLSTAVQTSPTIIRQPWLEDQLVAELRHGLEPMLPALGLDSMEGRRFLDQVLPAAFSEQLRVSHRLDDIDLRSGEANATPEIGAVRRWIENCETLATRRTSNTFGGSSSSRPFVVDPLPEDPALRIVLAMQTDWLDDSAENKTTAELLRVSASRRPRGESPEQKEARERAVMAPREEAPPLIADALAKAVASERFSGERIQMIGLLIVRMSSRRYDIPTHLRAAQLYAARPDADPWLASLYLGTILSDKAWLARGEKFASETSPDQFAALHAGLDLAYEQLVKAHQIAPHRPHAAGVLVGQALGSSNPAHEAPWYWFREALRADPTWSGAFRPMNNVVLRRWGGSADDRLALIRERQRAALEPGSGSIAMSAWVPIMAQEDDGRQSAARLFEETLVGLRPLWKDADESTVVRTRVEPNDAWSLALVLACQSGNVAAATELLEEKGRTYAERTDPDFLEISIDWDHLLNWSLARHPSDGELFLKMNAAFAKDDWDATVQHATALLATAKSWRAAEFAKSTLLAADASRRFGAGESVDLVARQFRDGWDTDPPFRERLLGAEPITLAHQKRHGGFRGDAIFPLRLDGRFRLEMDLRCEALPRDQTGSAGPSFALQFVDSDRRINASDHSVTFDGSRELYIDHDDARQESFGLFVRRGSVQGMRAASSRPRGSPQAASGYPTSIVIDVEGSIAHVFLDGVLFDILTWTPPKPDSKSQRFRFGSKKRSDGIRGDLTFQWYAGQDDRILIDSIRVVRVNEPLPSRTLDSPK